MKIALFSDIHANRKDSIRVEFVRFTYDVEKAARAVESSSLPPIFAKMLRDGY